MVFWPLIHGIYNSLFMACRTLTHSILTPVPMVYRTPSPWYIEPYTWYFDHPNHGISNPLAMVYRTPFPWYFDPLPIVFWTPTNHLPMVCWPPLHMVFWPPTNHLSIPIHGILNPVPIVIWSLNIWYIKPSIHGILTPTHGALCMV